MRRVGILILLMLALPACDKEVAEVSFHIRTHGFSLKEASQEASGQISEFTHRLSGGKILFTGDERFYEFYLGSRSIEEYDFHLPPGEYLLEVFNPPASLYGQNGGSFLTDPVNVVITDTTTALSLEVEANCAQLWVKDENDQLENGAYIIERHSFSDGYFFSYPMELDSISGWYYTYLTPDTSYQNPSAFVWLYNKKPGGEEGGMPTHHLESGYQYYLTVLD